MHGAFYFLHFSLVKELNFSVVVFDTAPTGHTLRFLSMPSLFEKGMAKFTQLKSQFGALFEQVNSRDNISLYKFTVTSVITHT